MCESEAKYDKKKTKKTTKQKFPWISLAHNRVKGNLLAFQVKKNVQFSKDRACSEILWESCACK